MSSSLRRCSTLILTFFFWMESPALLAQPDLPSSAMARSSASTAPQALEPSSHPTRENGASLEEVARQLSARGWRVVRDDEGNLVLYPRRQSAEASMRSGKKVDSKPDEKLRQHGEPNRPVPHTDLVNELQAAGWRVEHASKGALILRPANAPRPTATRRSTGRPVLDRSARTLLEKAGWTLEESKDGTIALHPPRQPKLATCSGIQTSANVDLPVDRWKEARRIAERWIEEQHLRNVVPGRIRHILKIHLVSIVSAEAPHRLRHQIAIRNQDGRVVLLW